MAEDGMETYIQILLQSLDNKLKVMKEIEGITKEQEGELSIQEPNMDQFERLLEQKETLIHKLDELDRGFESIFKKIKKDLEANKFTYRTYIEGLQSKIKDITDVGIRIQALEHKNKGVLETFFANSKMLIKNYNVNQRTASNYYKNMTNQHQVGQSYFLNKKK